jgi:hypothetical protein
MDELKEKYAYKLPSGSVIAVAVDLQKAKTARQFSACSNVKLSGPPTAKDVEAIIPWILDIVSATAKHANCTMYWSSQGVPQGKQWACHPDGRKELV